MIIEMNNVVEDSKVINGRTENVISHILDTKNIYDKFMSVKDVVWNMSYNDFKEFVINNCGVVLVCGIDNGVIQYDNLNYNLIKNRLYR